MRRECLPFTISVQQILKMKIVYYVYNSSYVESESYTCIIWQITHTYLPPSGHGRKSYLSAILPSHLLVGEGLITQFIHQRKLVLHAPGIN